MNMPRKKLRFVGLGVLSGAFALKRRLVMCPAIRMAFTGIVVFLAAAVSAHGQSITSFDPPGSTYTQPLSINIAGAVAGFYRDGVTIHGFIRDANGTFTTVDAPGSAGCHTDAFSINNAGAVAGNYCDAGSRSHGYVRDANGTFTTFD